MRGKQQPYESLTTDDRQAGQSATQRPALLGPRNIDSGGRAAATGDAESPVGHMHRSPSDFARFPYGFGVGSARRAWEELCNTVYIWARTPLARGQEVRVVKDEKVEGLSLKKGMKGKIIAVGQVSDVATVRVKFDTGREVLHRGSQLLLLETQDHRSLRANIGMYVIAFLVIIAFFAAIGIYRAVIVRGPGVSMSAATAIAKNVPLEGCCSWKAGFCGHTTHYCMVRSNCERQCKGMWLMPE